MRYFSTIWTILNKDVIMELRSKEVVNSMLIFSFLTVIVFSFIFEPGSTAKNEVLGGIYWMAVIFSGVLGLSRSMMIEVQGGNLEAMLLAPVDRSAVFFGKVASNFVFLTVMQMLILPIFSVLYGANVFQYSFMPAVVILLGTFGFAVVGTLFSIISVKTKTREIMLPLLLLPVMVPLILAAIQATNVYIMGGDLSGATKWVNMIVAFDLIFSAVIFAVFNLMIEE